MIELIEERIITTLKRNFNEYSIESFPVDFQSYNFTSPKGCILLRYENHKSTIQNTVTCVNANKKYNFTIVAAIRYATKHSDCYPLLNKVETTLNGLPILGKRLVVDGGKFETEINGDLWYSFDLSITFPINDEHKDLSEANKIIFNHEEEII